MLATSHKPSAFHTVRQITQESTTVRDDRLGSASLRRDSQGSALGNSTMIMDTGVDLLSRVQMF